MLTKLLKDNPDVAAALSALVYDTHPNIKEVSTYNYPSMLAPPRTDHYALVGTAFDYLIRWELQRRNPLAKDREWVATTAVEHVLPLVRDRYDAGTVELYQAVHAEARKFFEKVWLRSDGSSTAGLPSAPPPPGDLVTRASRYAVCLAKIDPLFRTGKVDPTVHQFDPLDVEDLETMFGIVPWDTLGAIAGLHRPILNPDFGSLTARFQGADADLIVDYGDGTAMLVDFKASKYATGPYGFFKHFPQLVGYTMIADLYREKEDPNFPYIAAAGIYFARHGILRQFDARAVRDHAEYETVREWLLEKADALPRPKPSKRSVTIPWLGEEETA